MANHMFCGIAKLIYTDTWKDHRFTGSKRMRRKGQKKKQDQIQSIKIRIEKKTKPKEKKGNNKLSSTEVVNIKERVCAAKNQGQSCSNRTRGIREEISSLSLFLFTNLRSCHHRRQERWYRPVCQRWRSWSLAWWLWWFCSRLRA
jgi:hypothetical protein